ncbi:hypothetical protein BT96DRAFT_331146 [Gymnopus androsaceus JB14]|uniref:Uncharacterized protein n=1 Tax=Gymnopus androsaceus JB14 TaxID=1447944 RepID=A0A6A4H0P1_9AGAR|nr:hypothetical protein BT96DRAFT_331146 [Gymnopus androsaceus JB14]
MPHNRCTPCPSSGTECIHTKVDLKRALNRDPVDRLRHNQSRRSSTTFSRVQRPRFSIFSMTKI